MKAQAPLKPRYDIVIAGGGMVGASLAIALGEALGSGLDVLVVESIPLPAAGPPGYQPSFDARSTALAAGSREIYQRLGLWQQLATHVCPIETIHVSTRGRPGSTLMAAGEENLPALGYVVENQWLGKVLLAALADYAGLHWCAPATVAEIGAGTARGTLVAIEREEQRVEVACELLVIADGARSALARSLGINYRSMDYGHQAIIANVATGKPHGGMAFERFTDQGPMALLPLPPEGGASRSALVWTLSDALAGEVTGLDDGSFLAALQQRFGYRLGAFRRVGSRDAYPLQLVEAEEQVRTGVVVMGNAAHFLHPVAGQGFNLALRDVARLVEVLGKARAAGRRLGELAVLQDYQQAQAWDQRATTVFSDRVSEVFAWSQPLVGMARDIGLSALDVMVPAKSWFVRQAAGLGGSGTAWPGGRG